MYPSLYLVKPRPGGWDMPRAPCDEDEFYKAEHFASDDKIFCRVRSPPRAKKQICEQRQFAKRQNAAVAAKKSCIRQSSCPIKTALSRDDNMITIQKTMDTETGNVQRKVILKNKESLSSSCSFPMARATSVPEVARDMGNKYEEDIDFSSAYDMGGAPVYKAEYYACGDKLFCNSDSPPAFDQTDEEDEEMESVSKKQKADEADANINMANDADEETDFSARYTKKSVSGVMPDRPYEDHIATDEDKTSTEMVDSCQDYSGGVGKEKNACTRFLACKQNLARQNCTCNEFYWEQYPDLDRCICGCNVNDHNDIVDKQDTPTIDKGVVRAESSGAQGQRGLKFKFLEYALWVGLAGVAGGSVGAAGVYLWFRCKR